jgi:class 3 adenylate cyclase
MLRQAAGEASMRRRLTVILASDVAGYSRLVAAAEEETILRLRQAADIFSHLVTKHHGRVFDTAGDAILADFDSAVDATRCAIDIQDVNNAANADLPADRRLLFRIGIAIGDVLVGEGGGLLGDAVNIAARLEGLAEPGGICVSDDVRSHVANKIALNVVDLGEQSLKNIPRRIRVFKLMPGAGQAAGVDSMSSPAWPRRVWSGSAAALAAIVAAAILYWHFGPRNDASTAGPPFDPADVPLVFDAVREQLAAYGGQPNWKAIAISRRAWGEVEDAPDIDSAKQQALELCRQRDKDGGCRIYAVGNTVVWPRSRLPMPMPADVHAEPLETPFTADNLANGQSQVLPYVDQYIRLPDHRAVAQALGGSWFVAARTSRAEAVRLALERCGDLVGTACLLYSVDGFLTLRIPRAYRVTTAFTLAGETTMSADDKQRLAPIYGQKDWRALARGKPGRWYAVGGIDTEEHAADKAMDACRQIEPECVLHAIGNFRVDGRLPG